MTPLVQACQTFGHNKKKHAHTLLHWLPRCVNIFITPHVSQITSTLAGKNAGTGLCVDIFQHAKKVKIFDLSRRFYPTPQGFAIRHMNPYLSKTFSLNVEFVFVFSFHQKLK